MKSGLKIAVLLCLFMLALGLPHGALAQPASEATAITVSQPPACALAGRLYRTLQAHHVAPPRHDSLFARHFFNQFLQHLDPQGLFLTQADVNRLELLFQNGAAAVKDPDCLALQTAVDLFSRQYLLVDSLRMAMLEQPLEFKEDTLLLSLTTTIGYAQNREELIMRWKKQLAYMVLYEASTMAGNQPLDMYKEAIWRHRVQDRLACRRNKLLQGPEGLEGHVSDYFLQAIATAFDPHSNYLPPATRDMFVASLSVQAVSFGIELEENQQGDIQISRLLPGGPAWKSKALHVGDIMLGLRSKSGIQKDFACLDLEEADEMLADANFNHAFITVRKKTGRTKTVELIKERLQVEENTVSSFLLKGDQPIGYLSLPAFYTQMDGSAGEGAASQVAGALLQLKRMGIQGLILDLRYNGGGSVLEALSLASLFIDEGPLGLEVSKGEKPQPIMDMYRGAFYEGPLLVLVNGLTASAAEILAMALQDYNRALIVGSTTYGKATIQVMMPLTDQHADVVDTSGVVAAPVETAPVRTAPVRTAPVETSDVDTLPFVKVTIGKYYGVNANSYQARGIIPHIALEDGLAAFALAEANQPTALSADVIDAKTEYRALAPLPVNDLKDKSRQRLMQNRAYAAHQQRTAALHKASQEGFPLRLNPGTFQQDYQQLISLMDTDQVVHETQPALPFKLISVSGSQRLFRRNTFLQENNQRFMKALMGDVWLGEAYHIMQNLLEIQPK